MASSEEYTNYEEHPVDIKDVITIRIKPGKKRREIKDLAADLVYGVVPTGEGSGLEDIGSLSIASYPKYNNREHRILHRAYNRYKAKKDRTEFENIPLSEVKNWDKGEQQRWFAAQMNKGARTVLPPLAAVISLPWLIEGAIVNPVATGLGIAGAAIGGGIGAKIDTKRHGLSDASFVGSLVGGVLGGGIGNTVQAFFPKFRLAVPTSVNKPSGNFENYFSRKYDNPTPESTFGRILQKASHPREQAYYHGSPTEFDIKSAHMGTRSDMGLHMGSKPVAIRMANSFNSQSGGYVYKIYSPKHNLTTFDTWANGVNNVQGPHHISAKSIYTIPKKDNMFLNAMLKYGKGKINILEQNDDVIRFQTTDAFDIPVEEMVWTNRPTNAANKLSTLRQARDKILLKTGNSSILDDIELAKINSDAAKVLSDNGIKVVRYYNNNHIEGYGYAYYVTDPKWIRLPISERFSWKFLPTIPSAHKVTKLNDENIYDNP